MYENLLNLSLDLNRMMMNTNVDLSLDRLHMILHWVLRNANFDIIDQLFDEDNCWLLFNKFDGDLHMFSQFCSDGFKSSMLMCN